MGERPPASHRTIFVVDVEGFGDRRRTNKNQVAVRTGLKQAWQEAFVKAGISWADCAVEDRGDGVFVLAPAEMPKAPFVDVVPGELAKALRRHNETHSPAEQIRLRMALHAGEVELDEIGSTGASIMLAFRLLNAAPLRDALVRSNGVLALITSDWFYQEVVRQSSLTRPDAFRQVWVAVKETSTTAWLSLPDQPTTTRKFLPVTSTPSRLSPLLRSLKGILTGPSV